MRADIFFNSKNFAVIGASRDEKKVGNSIFRNLISNKSLKVFPVNPSADEIEGYRCFRSILEIPYNIDCAVIAVKSEIVKQIMEECAKKRVKSAVIISAGFSESGNKNLELEIKEIADKNKIVLLGPNVLGFVSSYKGINASFFNGMPKKGNVSILSQSGALGVGILDMLIKEEVGLSGFVSLGNSAQMDVSDFIDYFAYDSNTKTIILYLESLKEARGKKFIEACSRCRKKIYAIKSGKTSAGMKAAQSHTAALASEKGVYEGVFKQCRITEISNLTELFNICKISNNPKFRKIGKKACIITNAGGLGVLSSDYLSQNNIEIPELPAKVKDELNKILPEGWSRNNPIDLVGDALAERYENTINVLEKEKFFDFFIVLLTPQHMTQPLETAKVIFRADKPAFACFFGGNKIKQAVEYLNYNGIPVFSEPKELADVLGKITG